MRKRIKARVKETHLVPECYAKEILVRGRRLTEVITGVPREKELLINNIRYKGKVYFVVRVRNPMGCVIKECIELP